MKKATREQIEKMEDKYYQLVWYARKRPEDFAIPGVEAEVKSVEFLFENETNDLKSEDGDFYHGFNSGMLAAMRFVLNAEYGHLDMAIAEFPFLDT